MKSKKYSYIIVLILMLAIGVNKTYANTFLNSSNEKLTYYEEKNMDMSLYATPISDKEGTSVDVDCDTLFGSKSDPDSLRYLINEILAYPKIIVPILIILMGSIDMATAVISPKEDGMKKAQEKFIKRLIMGVAIFFVPALIDALMWLADIVWAGTGLTTCGV